MLMSIVERVVRECMANQKSVEDIPVGVSNRHIHLSQADLEALFGPGAVLHNKKDLKQPGQFACEEVLTVIGPKGSLKKVRVLGPVRPESQVEVSKTDARTLGVTAPVRESGVLAGTPGVVLEGPCGKVELDHGVIVAQRHIHLDPETANALNVKDKDSVCVETFGERGCILKNVTVRVSSKYAPEMHVDTDETNACQMKDNDMIRIKKD